MCPYRCSGSRYRCEVFSHSFSMSSLSDHEWSAKLEESLRDEAASFYILSFRLRGAPHGTYESQRWPKRAQKAPKGAPRRAEVVPEGVQDGPKDGPGGAQESPRAPQSAPQRTQRAPRSSQDGPDSLCGAKRSPHAAKDTKTHDWCCPRGGPGCSNIRENA